MVILPLDDIVTWLATAWSIDSAIAGTILSMVLILAVMLPVMLASRNAKNAHSIWFILLFMLQTVMVGIAWLPLWTMMITIMIGVLAFSQQISNMFGG